MEQVEVKLPFNLRLVDLAKVEFAYEHHVVKPEVEKTLVTISGIRGATFTYVKSPSDKPVEKSGKTDPVALVALLKMFADAHFFEMDENQTDPDAEFFRVLGLSLPGKVKRVVFSGAEQEPLNRLIGAIRLAAAFGVPEPFLIET